MAILQQPEDRYELALLQTEVAKALSDDVMMVAPELRAYRDEAIRALVLQLKGYILADHLENQEYEYTETELPRWLKWLDRFVVKRKYCIKMDAYYTYPEARVAMPDLGQARKVITFAKFRRPTFI